MVARLNPPNRGVLYGWEVVVVDDDPGSLEVARILLDFYGANVSTAVNGQEGLDLICTVRPRFIVTDLSMPVMDGWELIKRLKADPALAPIPIIALTAHAMVGDREKAIAAGCHNYMSKPLTPSTFMQDLLQLLIIIPEFTEALSA
jgi:CheY-like chemotaxis protein